uniref:Uncharacterized protein n=1 Tax=Lutzomyia longipalpis TaxID=7200 RepID=A0A1B0CLC3_LUTLO
MLSKRNLESVLILNFSTPYDFAISMAIRAASISQLLFVRPSARSEKFLEMQTMHFLIFSVVFCFFFLTMDDFFPSKSQFRHDCIAHFLDKTHLSRHPRSHRTACHHPRVPHSIHSSFFKLFHKFSLNFNAISAILLNTIESARSTEEKTDDHAKATSTSNFAGEFFFYFLENSKETKEILIFNYLKLIKY